MTIHKKYHGPLIALATIRDKKSRQALLKSLNPKIIRILAQIAANIINGDIKISEQQRKQLTKYKDLLRKLRDNKNIIARRRILINQSGVGFLPFLIPLIASTVGGLLHKTLS